MSQAILIISTRYSLWWGLCLILFVKFCFCCRHWIQDRTHGSYVSYNGAEFLALYFSFLSFQRASLRCRSWPWAHDPSTPVVQTCFSFLSPLPFVFLFTEGHSSYSFEWPQRRTIRYEKRSGIFIFPPFFLSDLLSTEGKNKPEAERPCPFIGGDDCICSISMDDWTLPRHHCVWYSNWCYHFLALHVGKGWWIISYIKSLTCANYSNAKHVYNMHDYSPIYIILWGFTREQRMCDGTNYYLVLCKFTVGSSGALKNIHKKRYGNKKKHCFAAQLWVLFKSNWEGDHLECRVNMLLEKKVHAFKNRDMP